MTTLEEKFAALQTLVEHFVKDGESVVSEVLLESVATGENIPDSHLTKINKYTRTAQNKEDLYTFPVLMIDTAPTRNMVVYTAESQKKSINAWKGTTYLFNSLAQGGGLFGQSDHTLQAASQVGRIYDARAVETPKGLIGSLGWVYTSRGTEKTDSFISLTDSGILKEVSIHVSVPGGVECSFCQDAFGNCKENSGDYHYPGDRVNSKGKVESKGSQTIYMSTGKGVLVPLELSAVACPGSVNAHILQDSEVENYKVVSLKEALGGSREVITLIHKENNMDPKAEALDKLKAIAEAAGVTLAKSVADPANAELVEAAGELVESKEDAEGGEGDESTQAAKKKTPKSGGKSGDGNDNDGDEDDGPGSTQSAAPTAIFEGFCPACRRDGKTEAASAQDDSEKIVAIRKEFQESVATIVEAAESKVAAAVAANADALKKAEGYDALFADLVEMTVDLAVKNGLKKETDRNAYQVSLAELSYSAVREIREAYRASGTSVTKEAKKEKLVQSMQERFKANMGVTKVETDADGNKSAVTARRARMGVTLK